MTLIVQLSTPRNLHSITVNSLSQSFGPGIKLSERQVAFLVQSRRSVI